MSYRTLAPVTPLSEDYDLCDDFGTQKHNVNNSDKDVFYNALESLALEEPEEEFFDALESIPSETNLQAPLPKPSPVFVLQVIENQIRPSILMGATCPPPEPLRLIPIAA